MATNVDVVAAVGLGPMGRKSGLVSVIRSQPSMVRVVQRALMLAQAAVALALVGAIATVLAGVVPTIFGAESFTVYSGSMEPAIHVGALAVVRAEKAANLRPGDIITYRVPVQPDVIVTHRLIAIEGTEDAKRKYRTKGDANSVEDLVLVDSNAILGKVIYSVPYAGYIIEYSKRMQGRMLLVGLPALLLVVDFLRGRVRQRAKLAAAEQLRAAAARGDAAAEQQRLTVLLERAVQALDAGHYELAQRAIDGILAADPRHEEAWLLKARGVADPEARRVLLQTALLVNPEASRIAAQLASLTGAGGTGTPAPGGGAPAGRATVVGSGQDG